MDTRKEAIFQSVVLDKVLDDCQDCGFHTCDEAPI